MLKRCFIAIALALCFAPIVLSRPQAAPPTIAGCPLQPADNIWNVPVDNLLLDANSAAYINTIGAAAHVHADFGSGTWLGFPIGIPYTTVLGTQATSSVIFQWPGESDEGPYPIPPNVPIEGDPNGNGDRHILLMIVTTANSTNCMPRTKWAINGTRVPARSSISTPTRCGPTRKLGGAAGFPRLPVWRAMMKWPQARSITRCASPHPRRAANTSGPARHEASSLTGTQYPPLGQRFRLKASFIIDNSFSPHAQVILRALKKYGMILADNGSSWYISGAPDERWDNDVLHELDVVHGSDFEAVDESALMVNANSGQALSDFTVSANPMGRAIDAGAVATYQLRIEKTGAFSNTITVGPAVPRPA